MDETFRGDTTKNVPGSLQRTYLLLSCQRQTQLVHGSWTCIEQDVAPVRALLDCIPGFRLLFGLSLSPPYIHRRWPYQLGSRIRPDVGVPECDRTFEQLNEAFIFITFHKFKMQRETYDAYSQHNPSFVCNWSRHRLTNDCLGLLTMLVSNR